MAYLNTALEKKFGENYNREDPKVIKFIDEFRKREFELYGSKVSILNTTVSWIDFIVGMSLKFKGETAIVTKTDFRDVDDYEVYITLSNGKEEVITAEDCDTYYYFDDFFTRPNDKLLLDFGFEKIKEKNEKHGEMETVKEVWKYKGNHPATKLPDYWFMYVYSTKIFNSPIEVKIGEKMLAEYKVSYYCGMESQGNHHDFQIGMEHLEYLLNKSAVAHLPLRKKFVNEDIIITDPCYLFFDTKEEKEAFGISSTTLYGDWSCTVYEEESKKKIGAFCADAGQVGVYGLKDILKLHPDWKVEKETKYGSAALIKNFTGEVIIQYVPPVNEENVFDEGYVRVVGKGNINFFSSQTGL